MPECSLGLPSVAAWITTRMRSVQDLLAAVQHIRSERRTGKLTLNFAQGAIVSGEWTEKTKP